MQYEVIVQLKSEVLDPAGRAIKETLGRLGHQQLKDVRVGKRFVLEIEGADSEKTIEKIAQEYLANPVAETWQIRKL